VSISRFHILSLLLVLSIAIPTGIRADDLAVKIRGVEEPALSNVHAAVSPLRFAGVGRLTPRRLEQMRSQSELDAHRALRPFGYYQSTVSSTISKTGEETWQLDVNIVPGPPLLIRAASVELAGPGARLHELLEWKSQWPLRQGDVLVQPSWDEQKERALEISADGGYLNAEFSRSVMEVDLDQNTARLDLVLDTGEQAVMGEVRFHQDAVRPYITDNVPRFQPGDPYNSWIMERFRIDLWQLGYFESVEVVEDRRMDETPPRVDLDVQVEPRLPNTYQATVGVGSDTGPRLLFNWNRHLVSDRGDSFSLGAGWQEHNDELLVRGNYRVPRNTVSRQFWISEALMKHESEEIKIRDVDGDDEVLFSLGENDIEDYSIRMGHLRVRDRSRGFRQLFETWYAEYLNEYTDLNTGSVAGLIPPELRDALGGVNLAENRGYVSLGIDLDMPFTQGRAFDAVGVHHRAWAFVSSKSWGSDRDFSQLYLSSKWIQRAGEQWKILLRAEAGYSDVDVVRTAVPVEDELINISITQLPNYYRFKAGGSSSVRGYGFESLSDSNVGSNNVFTASAEVEYQVIPNWSLAAFYDIGNAFNSWGDPNLRQGIGVGVRWYSIAGAVRVDVAKPLDRDNDSWRIHFTIGASIL
jgi:translocation and assembly module TamA